MRTGQARDFARERVRSTLPKHPGGPLNATAEVLDDDKVKVTVTATPEEVDRAISKAYADLAVKVQIPGFRKGKVPRAVLEANIGRPTVLAQAAEDLVSSVFPDAIEQLALIPAEPAEVDDIDLVTQGEEFVFTAAVNTRPELTLSSTEGLTVSVESIAKDRLSDYEKTLQIIVADPKDPAGNPAWSQFTWAVDGDTIRITVKANIVAPINFIFQTHYFDVLATV